MILWAFLAPVLSALGGIAGGAATAATTAGTIAAKGATALAPTLQAGVTAAAPAAEGAVAAAGPSVGQLAAAGAAQSAAQVGAVGAAAGQGVARQIGPNKTTYPSHPGSNVRSAVTGRNYTGGEPWEFMGPEEFQSAGIGTDARAWTEKLMGAVKSAGGKAGSYFGYEKGEFDPSKGDFWKDFENFMEGASSDDDGGGAYYSTPSRGSPGQLGTVNPIFTMPLSMAIRGGS